MSASDARDFEFPLPTETAWEEVFGRVCVKAQDAGIAIAGDAAAGTFQGRARGSYEVGNGKIHVRIVKKPRLVPWSLVESNLRRAFTDGQA